MEVYRVGHTETGGRSRDDRVLMTLAAGTTVPRAGNAGLPCRQYGGRLGGDGDSTPVVAAGDVDRTRDGALGSTESAIRGSGGTVGGAVPEGDCLTAAVMSQSGSPVST